MALPAILLLASLIASASVVGPASAQSSATPVMPQPRDPNMPAVQNTLPEKVDPAASGPKLEGPGTASDKLGATGGVVRPPAGVDSGIVTPAPVPDPGTTPVIPPPGTPGSAAPNAQPK